MKRKATQLIEQREEGFLKHTERLPPILWKCLGITCLLWVLSGARLAYQRTLPKHGLPPLFGGPWFTDLLSFSGRFHVLHKPQFFTGLFPGDVPWVYPAPCVFLYNLLLWPSLNVKHGYFYSWLLYLVLSMLLIGSLALGFFKKLTCNGVKPAIAGLFCTATLLLFYPIAFSIHQGNIETLLWPFLAFGVYALLRDRWWAGCILVGLAASFKLYPIVFLVLALNAKKWKPLAAGLVVFAFLTLLSLAFIGPSIPMAFAETQLGLTAFKGLAFAPVYVEREWLFADHSLVALVRVVTSDSPSLMTFLGRVWIPFFSIFLPVLYYVRVRHLPRPSQLLYLSTCLVLFAPKSYDYTLQMLLIPWAALVLLALPAEANSTRIAGLHAALLCMAVVFSPLFFVKFHQSFYSGQAATFFLLALFVIALRYPFPEARSGHGLELSVVEGTAIDQQRSAS